MKKTVFSGILLFQLFFTARAQNISADKISAMNSDSLKKYMIQTINDFGIPGISISIFTGDRVLNEQVCGLRRLYTTDSIRITDRFDIESNGKAMTGFVAARLVEKGLIGWDTKVFDILPELKDSSNVAYYNISFRDLLSHRAGLRTFLYDDDLYMFKAFKGDIKKREYDFCKWLLKQEPVKIDSALNYTYSNTGYILAALLMEKITGKEWIDIIAEELFNPLEINFSIGWPALTDIHQPWGHKIPEGDSLLRPQSPLENFTDQDDELLTPAGNYSMNLRDYTKFLQLNLLGLNGKDTLLKSSTYKDLHFCNFDSSVSLFPFYSIGWVAFQTKDAYKISTHTGADATCYCMTVLHDDQNWGLTIAINAANEKSIEGVTTLKRKIEKYFK